MRIQVIDRQRRLPVVKSALKTIARVALTVEDPGSRSAVGGGGFDEIGISLVTDGIMRELNETHRRLDRTTDVLSFDLGRMTSGGRIGEVLISTDRVLVQARRYRVTPARELARLLVHGLLHLRGFDHQRTAERRCMRAVEHRLLREIGPAIARLEPRRPVTRNAAAFHLR